MDELLSDEELEDGFGTVTPIRPPVRISHVRRRALSSREDRDDGAGHA
ncbi:hypothetical protein AB0230_12550 [Microbacterium sp. NPDC089190]